MQASAPERLVRVDVADARHTRLGQQERLEWRRAPLRELEEPLRGQLARQRLDPEPRPEVFLQRIALVEDDRLPEAPHVGEQQLSAVVELEARADVSRLRRRLV